MQLNKFLIVAATTCTGLSATSISSAGTVVTFRVPDSFSGGSVEGFTFSPNWQATDVYGRPYGSINAPFMQWFDQVHTITFDDGQFNFESISLGGSPYNDYYGGINGGTAVVNMHFFGIDGTLIEDNKFSLPTDNDFYSFTKDIAGVHMISFDHAFYWPRLNSVTTSAVPEPKAYAMLLVGLAVLGASTRRGRQRAE